MDEQKHNIYLEIEQFTNCQYKEQLIKLKQEIDLVLNNLKDELLLKNLFWKISSIISLIIKISTDKIEQTKKLYESFLRRDEQTIRILYKNLFSQKLLIDSQDNKLRLLNIKEKEYELVKEKTGAYVKDGQIVFNKQKDNEIIILRQENSNLKSTVEKYEKTIKEKDILIVKLKKLYNSITKKNSCVKKNKKLLIPNINTNLNDSNNFSNADNLSQYPININNARELLKNKINRQNLSNFNYLKYKNISGKKSIHFKNCLTSRDNLQSCLDEINQKEIYSKIRSSSKNNIKSKLEGIKSEYQKDSCSLKKFPQKSKDVFYSKKKVINLLSAYTSGSSKNINKFYVSQSLSNFIGDELSSCHYSKIEKPQKNNSYNNKNILNKNKSNKNISEEEKLCKSYIPIIPFNNDRKINYKRKRLNNENYKNRSELYANKNSFKKYGNIDTKNIFY